VWYNASRRGRAATGYPTLTTEEEVKMLADLIARGVKLDDEQRKLLWQLLALNDAEVEAVEAAIARAKVKAEVLDAAQPWVERMREAQAQIAAIAESRGVHIAITTDGIQVVFPDEVKVVPTVPATVPPGAARNGTDKRGRVRGPIVVTIDGVPTSYPTWRDALGDLFGVDPNGSSAHEVLRREYRRRGYTFLVDEDNSLSVATPK